MVGVITNVKRSNNESNTGFEVELDNVMSIFVKEQLFSLDQKIPLGNHIGKDVFFKTNKKNEVIEFRFNFDFTQIISIKIKP